MSAYGLWLSAAGLKVSEHRQAVLAHNLANGQTTGFKQDMAVVAQRRVESRATAEGAHHAHPVLDGMGGGLHVWPSYRSFAQGPIEHTGRALDVAIQGDGFLAVSNGRETRYTRDGQLAVNSGGELVMSSGEGRWRVLDETGQVIRVDQEAGPVRVSESGRVWQGEAEVARLGLVDAADRQRLRKTGGNLFAADDVVMMPVAAQFRAESREGSNFDIMQGLADMIEASRAYQLNANLISMQDQTLGQVVSTVGRLA